MTIMCIESGYHAMRGPVLCEASVLCGRYAVSGTEIACDGLPVDVMHCPSFRDMQHLYARYPAPYLCVSVATSPPICSACHSSSHTLNAPSCSCRQEEPPGSYPTCLRRTYAVSDIDLPYLPAYASSSRAHVCTCLVLSETGTERAHVCTHARAHFCTTLVPVWHEASGRLYQCGTKQAGARTSAVQSKRALVPVRY
eukprot:2510958-Rhodomonas_salina.2